MSYPTHCCKECQRKVMRAPDLTCNECIDYMKSIGRWPPPNLYSFKPITIPIVPTEPENIYETG